MDLLSKKYKQAEEISNLKAEIDRLNRCLMESLTHEKNALDVSIKYKAENEKLKALCETYRTCYQAKHSDIKCWLPKYRKILQEIKVVCDYENEYNSIGIDDYKKIIRDIVNLIAKTEVK